MTRRAAATVSRNIDGPFAGAISFGVAPTILVSLLAIPVALLALAAEIGTGAPDSYALVLMWATVSIAAVRLTVVFVRGAPNLIDAFFWVFIYAAYGVPGLMQLATGVFPWPVAVSTTHLVLAEMIVLVGMGGWGLGQLLRNARSGRDKPSRTTTVSVGRLWVMLALYIALLPFLLQLRGGWNVLFLARLEAWQQNQLESTGLATLVLAAIRCVPVVILAAALLHARLRGWHGVRALVFVALPLALITSNPISNNRYWLVAATTLVVVSAFVLQAWARRLLLVSVTVVALFGFPLMDYFRRSTSGDFGQVGVAAMLTADYDTLKNTAMAVAYVDLNGFSWGRQILGIILFWVPREIWADKPMDTGATIAEGMGMTFTQIAGPLWLEGYLAAGLPGVLVVMTVSGYIFASVYRSSRGLKNERAILVQAFLIGYVLILIRGSVLQAMLTLTFVIFLIVLVTPRIHSAGGRAEASQKAVHPVGRSRRRLSKS